MQITEQHLVGQINGFRAEARDCLARANMCEGAAQALEAVRQRMLEPEKVEPKAEETQPEKKEG